MIAYVIYTMELVLQLEVQLVLQLEVLLEFELQLEVLECCKIKTGIAEKGKPGHLATRQSLVSVGSPGHEPSFLLQGLALILAPLPQVVEH